MSYNRTKCPLAFTMVELLVVVAIIMVLLSILLPSFKVARRAAISSICQSNLAQQATTAIIYGHDFGGDLPPQQKWNNILKPNHFSRYFRYHSAWRNLGFAWESGHLVDARILYCPGQRFEGFMLKTYSDPSFPSNARPGGTYHLPTPAIRFSYNFNPQATSEKNRERMFTDVGSLTARGVFGVDVIEYVEAISHPGPSWNVVRGDSSVGNAVAAEVEQVIRQDPIGMRNHRYAKFDELLRILLDRSR